MKNVRIKKRPSKGDDLERRAEEALRQRPDLARHIPAPVILHRSSGAAVQEIEDLDAALVPSRRHDGRYVPTGFVEDPKNGRLAIASAVPVLHDFCAIHPVQPADEARLRAAIASLTRILKDGRASQPGVREVVAATVEALAAWRHELVVELWLDALARENARRGDPRRVDAIDRVTDTRAQRSDASLLAALRERVEAQGETLPPELTARALGAMRARCSLSGGGGRGASIRYSAQQLVARFAARIGRRKV